MFSSCTYSNFIANFIKRKFGVKNEVKKTVIKEEQVKHDWSKRNFYRIKDRKSYKELLNKLNNIEIKADEVYEKVKKKKKKNMKRD